MAFCSSCGVEYIETAETCSDCQQPLKPKNLPAATGMECIYCTTLTYSDAAFCWNCGSRLQDFDFDNRLPGLSGEVLQCENCGRRSPPGTDFCIECGFLFTGSRSCIKHPGRMTDFVCLVCQNPLCKKCGKIINGKFICQEDRHYHFVGNWAVVVVDTHREALEPARLALDDREIYAVIKNQMDTAYPVLTGQFLLLVPAVQLKKAETLLIEEKLLYENVCTNCRHEFNGIPNRCPACGEEFAF